MLRLLAPLLPKSNAHCQSLSIDCPIQNSPNPPDMAHDVNACLPTDRASRGWELGRGRRREGVAVQWAHSRLDNHCDANCQGGKMSIGGAAKERERERETGAGGQARVVKGPTPSSPASLPPMISSQPICLGPSFFGGAVDDIGGLHSASAEDQRMSFLKYFFHK